MTPKSGPASVPQEVVDAAAVYLADPRTRTARMAFLNTLLTGMTVAPLSVEAVVRGLEDMAVTGAEFRPVVVRKWCQRAVRLLEGEAGQRAAEASKAVLGRPDAKQTPSSGWSEDESVE